MAGSVQLNFSNGWEKPTLSGSRREVCCAPNLGHRAMAIPELEAAIRARRLNRRKKFAGRCRFPKTPFVVLMPGR
jgi:hypothetical protein